RSTSIGDSRIFHAARDLVPNLQVQTGGDRVALLGACDGIVEINATSLIPSFPRQQSSGYDILGPRSREYAGLLATMVRGEAKNRPEIWRIAQIKAATGMPLTLHGGSGTDDDDFRCAIEAGMTTFISAPNCAWRGAAGWTAAGAGQPRSVTAVSRSRRGDAK